MSWGEERSSAAERRRQGGSEEEKTQGVSNLGGFQKTRGRPASESKGLPGHTRLQRLAKLGYVREMLKLQPAWALCVSGAGVGSAGEPGRSREKRKQPRSPRGSGHVA